MGNRLGDVPVGLKFSQTQQQQRSSRRSVTSGRASGAVSPSRVAWLESGEGGGY